MYYMDHLLTLLTFEKARELRFHPGSPPVVVSEEEQRSLLGPAMTREDVMQLLRCLANSRHVRELRQSGTVSFVYNAPGRSPFLVRARIQGDTITFEIS